MNAPRPSDEQAGAAILARRYLAARRRRGEMVGYDLFADPAWDMLLDLFAAKVEGRRVSVSSACIASCCPTSTAIFWIRKLQTSGLIERRPDARDRRRTHVEITPAASTAIEQWLQTAFA